MIGFNESDHILLNPLCLNAEGGGIPGLNVADAGSRRVRRVNFVGPVRPAPMQETEAFREGEGITD